MCHMRIHAAFGALGICAHRNTVRAQGGWVRESLLGPCSLLMVALDASTNIRNSLPLFSIPPPGGGRGGGGGGGGGGGARGGRHSDPLPPHLLPLPTHTPVTPSSSHPAATLDRVGDAPPPGAAEKSGLDAGP